MSHEYVCPSRTLLLVKISSELCATRQIAIVTPTKQSPVNREAREFKFKTSIRNGFTLLLDLKPTFAGSNCVGWLSLRLLIRVPSAGLSPDAAQVARKQNIKCVNGYNAFGYDVVRFLFISCTWLEQARWSLLDRQVRRCTRRQMLNSMSSAASR